LLGNSGARIIPDPTRASKSAFLLRPETHDSALVSSSTRGVWGQPLQFKSEASNPVSVLKLYVIAVYLIQSAFDHCDHGSVTAFLRNGTNDHHLLSDLETASRGARTR